MDQVLLKSAKFCTSEPGKDNNSIAKMTKLSGKYKHHGSHLAMPVGRQQSGR